MSKVNCDMSMSVDGFVAGPNQSLANPFGEGVGDRLHRWMFEEPETNAAEIQGVTAAGAFIMGRNMFGPGRHDWDLDWRAGGATSRPTTGRSSS
jgi:dihydrofolate reductase